MGGQSAHTESSDQKITADLLGKKKEARKKGKIEKKRRKIVKGKVEIENVRWKSYKMRRGPFFFLSFFLFLFFFLLLTFQNH